jgi:hypothetical protein
MNKKRPLAERTPQIHVRSLREAGVTHERDAISIYVTAGHVEQYVDQVSILWRASRFGGYRAYFLCPGCGAGAMILYAARSFLACRNCHGLAYRSENLTPLWRKREKLSKLQRKAGAHTSRIPPKPKWQRWHTYLNLCREIKAADHDFAAAYLRSRHGSALLR